MINICGSDNMDENYDFEASIQKARILKILNDTIKNTEVVLCLPLLLANESAVLQQFFSTDQTNFISKTCDKFEQEMRKPMSSKVDPMIMFQADMCLVIDLLLSKPDLGDFCRTSLSDSISKAGITLLRNLEELRICVSERLKVTPKMEAEQDAELRRLYQQNIHNKEEVEKLTEKLNKLTTETENEIEKKNQLIKKQVEKITTVKKQCRDNVKKKMDEADRQINWDVKNSEYRIDELQTEVKNSQYRRDIQLKEHLNTERDLRAKRYKVESQLVAMLQKYDTDIGERQAMLEELTANYEEEKQQMATLQKQFDEQEVEYVNLMLEKEQYEKQQFDAKLYDIRCRIAARKIQRYFRGYLATKSKGKKGKKGKKKK